MPPKYSGPTSQHLSLLDAAKVDKKIHGQKSVLWGGQYWEPYRVLRPLWTTEAIQFPAISAPRSFQRSHWPAWIGTLHHLELWQGRWDVLTQTLLTVALRRSGSPCSSKYDHTYIYNHLYIIYIEYYQTGFVFSNKPIWFTHVHCISWVLQNAPNPNSKSWVKLWMRALRVPPSSPSCFAFSTASCGDHVHIQHQWPSPPNRSPNISTSNKEKSLEKKKLQKTL